MLTREQILARKTGKGYATLPDGSQVGIRALTRDEVLEFQDLPTLAERENFIISTGMTDPKLSIEDVHAWASEADAGDLVAVSDGIATLSGLKPGADKDAYKTFRDEPGNGV
jgi:hypothetical protein